MSLQKELEKIKNNQLAPVYLVLGQEHYLRQTFNQLILEKVLSQEEDDLNNISFDMLEEPLSHAIGEAQALPFFGERRLVQIENPYFLTAEQKKNGPDHQLSELSIYLSQPSETTVLVIQAPYEKLDRRKKIVKELLSVARLIDVSPLSEREIRNYVQQTINNQGYEIARTAFDLLLRLTNLDLSQLMNELTKLFLASSETKKISYELVSQLVPKSLEDNIFEMITYVLKGETALALTLYEDLRLQGEETIKINAILISQFRLYLQVKLMLERGYQQANMVDVLKIHPYRIKLAVQAVRRLEQSLLISIFDQLVENDFMIKTGQMEQDLLFELFILKMGNLNLSK